MAGKPVDKAVARIFMHGRSQAVRLPKEFRLPGDRVRVKRVEQGILLVPIEADIDAWFAELDKYGDIPFPAPDEPPPLEDEASSFK